MPASPHLHPIQFSARAKKDPVHDKRKPRFSGQGGSKTMAVEAGQNLPTVPKRHPHRKHAGKRTRRAR